MRDKHKRPYRPGFARGRKEIKELWYRAGHKEAQRL